MLLSVDVKIAIALALAFGGEPPATVPAEKIGCGCAAGCTCLPDACYCHAGYKCSAGCTCTDVPAAKKTIEEQKTRKESRSIPLQRMHQELGQLQMMLRNPPPIVYYGPAQPLRTALPPQPAPTYRHQPVAVPQPAAVTQSSRRSFAASCST